LIFAEINPLDKYCLLFSPDVPSARRHQKTGQWHAPHFLAELCKSHSYH
jgi:hypothetical protein